MSCAAKETAKHCFMLSIAGAGVEAWRMTSVSTLLAKQRKEESFKKVVGCSGMFWFCLEVFTPPLDLPSCSIFLFFF